MYRVMIIDDERALRSLLKKTIDWEELSLEVVGEAASGIEAINIIDEIRPDIVFVDIRMPFMDGIEFSKLAIQRYPKLKIIVLTAFDDFTYARECIGIGVADYLLKPIVRTDIQQSLKKILAQLEQEKGQDKNEDTEDGKDLRMKSIKEYIEGHFDDPELNLKSVADNFGFNSSYFSRKFKEEIGRSFIDYLTSYRMEKACRYASRGELMYITAKLVGIPDPNYFGKCFKKYYDVSYSDFMKGERSAKKTTVSD
ncbi:response regulator transcription factor [Anaerobium acetethylicum]|uniref:Stage 0 sporulation protein A homolog n=1 Tax=Anaerobium acetethylicum TaxID=1619234 RepID=A0A1D3TNA8_9FIRM|nr:response regulator [Anaerobium acetethylicum]SCP94783.1 Helix-turn-helix domain-containing protein [Anaerobium acetethylicum]